MRKKMVIVALCSFLLCMLSGYYLTIWTEKERDQLQLSQESEMTQSIPLISSDTKMVYQYFYSRDRVTKEQVEMAPVFLQGLDMDQLKSVYNGWQVILFSPEKVILRCKIDGLSSETYIIGESDGFLAVFYEDGQKGIHLKEKTELPITSLPDGERLQVEEGLRITGEENLARVLADYLNPAPFDPGACTRGLYLRGV